MDEEVAQKYFNGESISTSHSIGYCYGVFGDVVVFYEKLPMAVVSSIQILNYKFEDTCSFTIIAYYNDSFYLLGDILSNDNSYLFDNEILTKEDVEFMYNMHNSWIEYRKYIAYNGPEKPYLKQ